MSQSAVKPVPQGMYTLTPLLVCNQADEAIAFYVKAFGAVELGTMRGPDGKVMHSLMKVGDSPFMLNDEWPDHGLVGPLGLKGTPVTLYMYVEDVDAMVERAVGAGAKLVSPPTDMFWGDRYAQVEDPCGHRWSIATHVRDVSSEELQAAVAKGCSE